MSAVSPVPLSPSGRRSLAAAMIRGAVPDVHPLVASTVVDLLDTVTGCILAGLSVSPAESRVSLDALWVQDPSTGSRTD